MLGFAVLAPAVIGPLPALLVCRDGDDRWSAVAAGAPIAGDALVRFLSFCGFIVVFGRASIALLAVVLAAAGYWRWTRCDNSVAARFRDAVDLARATRRTAPTALPTQLR